MFRPSAGDAATTLLMAVVFLSIFGFLAAYLTLRKRAEKSEENDEQLGIKAVINYFQFLNAYAALLGFALIFTALFAKIGSGDGSDLWKEGLGMLFGAGALFALFEAFYRLWTNQMQFGDARKVFFGMTLVVVGIVGSVSFLLFWMGLFSKATGLAFNLPFALWLIFLPATAGGMMLFRKMYFPPPAPAPGAFPGGGGGGYVQPGAQPAAQPGYPQQAPQAGYDQGYGQQGGYGQPQQPGYGGGSGGGPGLPPPSGSGGGGGYGQGGGGYGQGGYGQ